jgi:hypothetical protein
MSEKQRRNASVLIKEACANHDSGYCLLLSDYDYEPCPQLHSNSLICKYFRDAVLPMDKLLHAQIMGSESVKGCEICGEPFRAVSPRAKYCEKCSKARRQKATRERVRKHRSIM